MKLGSLRALLPAVVGSIALTITLILIPIVRSLDNKFFNTGNGESKLSIRSSLGSRGLSS